MRRPPAVPDFVELLGLHVRTPRGVYIGRVNDVDFEPETGAVTAVYYDEYGLPWLPPGCVNLFGIPTDAILDVRPSPSAANPPPLTDTGGREKPLRGMIHCMLRYACAAAHPLRVL